MIQIMWKKLGKNSILGKIRSATICEVVAHLLWMADYILLIYLHV
jgi:hypothetical protein